jgi:hypothetical protein
MANPSRSIGQALYAPAAAAAVLLQHAAIAMAHHAAGLTLKADVEFWLLPLRAFGRLSYTYPVSIPLALLCAIVSAGLVAFLSLWRARDANRGHLAALLTLVPILQIPAILALSLLPSRKATPTLAAKNGARHVADVVAGVVGGMGLCVFAVTVSALIVREYGYALFVLARSSWAWSPDTWRTAERC